MAMIDLTKEELKIAVDLIDEYLSEYGGRSEWFDLLEKLKFMSANKKDQIFILGETLSLDEAMLFGGKPIEKPSFEPQERTIYSIDKDLKSVTLSGPKIHRIDLHILYYRNVPRNVVMVKTGDYETLRKLEQEIRLIDPGNYLALHKLEPIKEEEIESIVKEVFNESTSI